MKKLALVATRCIALALAAMLAVLLLPQPAYASSFILPTTITIDGNFGDWVTGEPPAPISGVYRFQDASNTGEQDASVSADTLEDLNYFWTAVSTLSGGDSSPTNLIQDFYYRIDTWGDSDYKPARSYFIQLNCGTAPDGYADHVLQIHGYTNNTPVVTIVLYEYETPYPAFRAFATGEIIGKVSNVAEPYPQFISEGGVQDTNAAGARGLYDGTHYGIEVNIPVDWFGSTYGGSIKDDGTGPNLVASTVFSTSSGSLGSVGTVRDTLNDGNGKIVQTETSVSIGESTFTAYTWKSYDDSGHPMPQVDTFSDYGTQNIVYMFGAGFDASTQYRVVFWDYDAGEWHNRQMEDPWSDENGHLSAQHTFTEGTDTAGDWHCTVYDDTTYTPSTYDPNDIHLVADDLSYTGASDYAFHVEQSAIPEFPTIMAAIGVAGLCFGIYYWMRKKKLARVQT